MHLNPSLHPSLPLIYAYLVPVVVRCHSPVHPHRQQVQALVDRPDIYKISLYKRDMYIRIYTH